jgi:tRNA (guanine10-N2)-methyltransferase
MLLVEFVVRHSDFQKAELTSVLEVIACSYTVVELPVAPCANLNDPHCHRAFCLLQIHNSNKNYGDDDCSGSRCCPEESVVASTILSRCTLVRSVLEVWGYGDSLETCAQDAIQFRNNNTKNMPHNVTSYEAMTWSFTIQTLGTKYNREEQNDMRKPFAGLNLGRVCLDKPDLDLRLIREAELDVKGNPAHPKISHTGEILLPKGPPAVAWYFGRVLQVESSLLRRPLLFSQQSLKKRKYLGPTSMDAELSNVMANLAQVKPGSVVLDPFCGTGSILISCALLGAYCVGMDIDIRVLRGSGETGGVASNFRQFGLPAPELVRADNHLYNRHWRNTSANLYDAIVCDPPYGIRAGARKSGSKRRIVVPVKPELRNVHIAQTRPYPVADVMTDLLDTAARILTIGGHLVYILPSFAETFSFERDLPVHPCLETTHVCFQPFSADLGRRIVALRKMRDPCAGQLAKWSDPDAAEKCANIREKILEAAKLKPDYEKKAAFRKEKRKNHLQLKRAAKRTKKEIGGDVKKT